MKLSSKLLKLMGRTGESQEDVAAVAGVSQGLVSLWTRGRNVPDLDKALALARHFGVPLLYLADDSIDEPAQADPLTDADRKILAMVRTVGYETAERRLLLVSGEAPATLKMGQAGGAPRKATEEDLRDVAEGLGNVNHLGTPPKQPGGRRKG